MVEPAMDFPGGGAIKEKPHFLVGKRGFFSERDGVRTRNHRIDSPVL
jgi:hypothetical protein